LEFNRKYVEIKRSEVKEGGQGGHCTEFGAGSGIR